MRYATDRCAECGCHQLDHPRNEETGALVCSDFLGQEFCPDKGDGGYTCGWQNVLDQGTDSGSTNAGPRISRWFALACGHTLTEDIRQDHV